MPYGLRRRWRKAIVTPRAEPTSPGDNASSSHSEFEADWWSAWGKRMGSKPVAELVSSEVAAVLKRRYGHLERASVSIEEMRAVERLAGVPVFAQAPRLLGQSVEANATAVLPRRTPRARAAGHRPGTRRTATKRAGPSSDSDLSDEGEPARGRLFEDESPSHEGDYQRGWTELEGGGWRLLRRDKFAAFLEMRFAAMREAGL